MDNYYDYHPTHQLKKPLVLISFVNELTRAVANSLASTTGLPLRLIDDVVEHRLAASAIEFLAGAELEAWREREKQELAAALRSQPAAVVAVGEGALSDAESLALVLAESDCVYLYLSVSEAQRLALEQGANRKATLLAELRTGGADLEAGLMDLYERRRVVYEQAHRSVDVWKRSPIDVSRKLLDLLA